MSSVTAHISEKTTGRRPETGWATARRLREKGVRTCVPAVASAGEGRGGPRRDRTGAECNIVRGED
ncbi:hypothetical protein ABZ858_17870 [Streptomyces sp. NPDC047017]|uniref:hypothetical protein n=1 Tax=Streptomyces sp. NPDC047017 TaxID=3155024 RepID=UPI0033C990F0